MTKELAIRIITGDVLGTFDQTQEAVTMAVKALLSDVPDKNVGDTMTQSAQPERKKGKWTIEDCHAVTYRYCCSVCKAHHRARYAYCPSCGADMRGEQE